MTDDVSRLRIERDLYRGLLSLGEEDDLVPFLEEALSLVMRLSGAHHGLIELRALEGEPLRIARGLADAELPAALRAFSTSVVREALASGRTVSTANAIDDPRFSDVRSVQAAGLRAILCAPLQGGDAAGVLYLAERTEPGPFPEGARCLVELFAKHLAPLAGRIARARALNVDVTRELRGRVRADAVAGRSAALATVLQQILVAAPVPISLLVTGESGTGKTAVARAVHDTSPRHAGPFVDLNCAAIPEALFESELFGAEKGAHSTATRRLDGKIEAARGGTLFLDEIGELPLSVQAKLLGFLQSRSYFRLGGTKAVEADVRVVAATNRDLKELVAEKRFREDLFYRLDVLRIHVPPLRERVSDIALIADAILVRLAEQHGRRLALSRAAELALEESEWPGNVRQLENVIARGWATALAEGAARVDARHVFPDAKAEAPSDAEATEPEGWREATLRFQRRLLADTLAATSWNVAESARRLGVARSHMNELIRAHGLERPG